MATTQISNGVKYITAVYRGTEYTMRQGAFGWELSTRRLGYGGRFHIGGFKRFDTLAAVAAGCKAFGNETALLALAYGVQAEEVAA